MENQKIYLTPEAEIKRRLSALQKILIKKGADAALIIQKADLFYFSGTIQAAHLYVPAESGPILMVKKDFARTKTESALSRVVYVERTGEIPGIIREFGLPAPVCIGLETDVLPADLYFYYKKLFNNPEIIGISPEIRMIRAVKSEYELDMIRMAANTSDRLFALVPDLIRPKMTEIELAGLIEAEARKMGHQGIIRMRLWGSEIFYGHLMAGALGAVPSFMSSPTGGMGTGPATAQGPGNFEIKKNEPILVDYVFAANGYLCDQARIFSMDSIEDELVKAHETAIMIQDMIAKNATPGTAAGKLFEDALQIASENGLADYFMGHGPERIRFVGHGVGTELDEFPFLAMGQSLALEKGMTIAVEPKFVIPGKGVVGVENTFVVTEDGLLRLTNHPDGIHLLF